MIFLNYWYFNSRVCVLTLIYNIFFLFCTLVNSPIYFWASMWPLSLSICVFNIPIFLKLWADPLVKSLVSVKQQKLRCVDFGITLWLNILSFYVFKPLVAPLWRVKPYLNDNRNCVGMEWASIQLLTCSIYWTISEAQSHN